MPRTERRLRRFLGTLAAVVTLLAAAGWAVSNGQAEGKTVQASEVYYTCVMHRQIHRDKPGDCPVCGMTLVPVKRGGEAVKRPSSGGAPEKAEGVMAGLAPVRLSPYKQQLIGVRLAAVERAPVVRSIHTNGRFAGGPGDFAAMAGDFAARKTLKRSSRFVVADIYALDIPFVRVGQKAVVTALSGSGAKFEGRITKIYPDDGTQSRVTRVRVDLARTPMNELFANVDIEAGSAPTLSVPSSAVMDTGTRRYVFVQTEPGTFVPREIVTGFQGTGSWEVLSGLKEGERVVDGANFLIDADSKLKSAFTEEK